MSELDLNELERLTGLYLCDLASRADVARLNTILTTDPKAAQIFANACRLESVG